MRARLLISLLRHVYAGVSLKGPARVVPNLDLGSEALLPDGLAGRVPEVLILVYLVCFTSNARF
jgi:hypothetical protein